MHLTKESNKSMTRQCLNFHGEIFAFLKAMSRTRSASEILDIAFKNAKISPWKLRGKPRVTFKNQVGTDTDKCLNHKK